MCFFLDVLFIVMDNFSLSSANVINRRDKGSYHQINRLGALF